MMGDAGPESFFYSDLHHRCDAEIRTYVVNKTPDRGRGGTFVWTATLALARSGAWTIRRGLRVGSERGSPGSGGGAPSCGSRGNSDNEAKVDDGLVGEDVGIRTHLSGAKGEDPTRCGGGNAGAVFGSECSRCEPGRRRRPADCLLLSRRGGLRRLVIRAWRERPGRTGWITRDSDNG